jgi:hypothetical protein
MEFAPLFPLVYRLLQPTFPLRFLGRATLTPSHIPRSELLAAAQRLRTPHIPQKAIRTELFHIHKNKSCYKFNQLNTS